MTNNFGFLPSRSIEEVPHIVNLNARWTGDTLGWKKDTKVPVYGPAELRMISSREVRDRVDFDFLFNANWNNGDSVRFTISTTGNGGFDFVTHVHNENVEISGGFVGDNYEEVLGAFDDGRYLGSFGLKRR